MKMFHVYYESSVGPLKAVETTGVESIGDVEKLLPLHVNSYGVEADSPEEAIQKANEVGFKYVSREKMMDLKATLLNLKAQVD